MAHKRLATLNLNSGLLKHATRVGLKTIQDVLELPMVEIMKQLCLSADQTRELIDKLYGHCTPQHTTILQLLSDESELCVSVGDSTLDALLGGGMRPSAITELAGSAGVGKTQWCVAATVRCLLKNKHVIYIDTESAFRPKRVLEVLNENLPCEERHTIPDLLARVIVHQPTTVTSLDKIINELSVSAAENKTSLVIVDSIASLARKEFPPHVPGQSSVTWKRVYKMAGWIARLKSLATERKLVVLVTNQVTSKRAACTTPTEEDEGDVGDVGSRDGDQPMAVEYEQYVTPALGTTWAHFVNTRLVLQYTDEEDENGTNLRQVLIVKSPTAPCASFDFKITAGGIIFLGEGQYTYSGCDPSMQRLNVQSGTKLAILE